MGLKSNNISYETITLKMLVAKSKIYSGQFIIANNANRFRETANKIQEFKNKGPI